MIVIKTPKQIELMREAAKITAAARKLAGEMVAPGVSTGDIDREVRNFILKSGAKPTFLGYNGFPASVCISINNEVIHGIPGDRKLSDGDIVSFDLGATYKGYVGDCAATFACGTVTDEAKRLIKVTHDSFYEGIKYARAGMRVSDIGHAIQEYVEGHGFSVVRAYVGHGVGAQLHESPEVPNFGAPGRGARLAKSMTLAIEPMVNAGGHEILVKKDGWTVITADGSLSAHYENTILITDGAAEVLTALE